MAILKIKSSNPNLSFVIQKNPASGMFLKTLKQGMLFSYFPKVNNELILNEYIIYFKDSSDNITYKIHPDEQFEYLNSSKYNDARFINDSIQEILHFARENKGIFKEYDIPANQMIFINLVNTDFKTIDVFRRYFTDVEIRSTEISKNNFELSFISENKTTLQYMLKVVNLFGIFAQLNSPTYSYLTEDLIVKYLRIANEIDSPYFIKYLIKVRMCRSEKIFNNLKLELEKSNQYKIEMTYGDTHVARIKYIQSILNDDLSIIDIGTGIDFRYLKIYAPLLKEKGLTYYAIEIDLNAREKIKANLKNRNLEDCVEIFESLKDFYIYHEKYLTKEKFNVLCSEVLEHNEFSEAKKIVKTITNKINFDKFIVTVPNKLFNQFYGIEENSFRHDDHKWEARLNDLMNLIPENYKGTIHFDNIGDTITKDNHLPISVTHAMIFKQWK